MQQHEMYSQFIHSNSLVLSEQLVGDLWIKDPFLVNIPHREFMASYMSKIG